MAIQPLRLDPITVLGKQLVIELFDCVDQRFDDIQWIEESMLEAARQANATIITSAFHKFSPIGISGVVVIAESHLAIHTWRSIPGRSTAMPRSTCSPAATCSMAPRPCACSANAWAAVGT